MYMKQKTPLTLSKVDQSMSKTTTEIVEYKPSANQEKWIDIAIQMETDEIKAIAEACDIDRTTWYQWLKQDGFIEWFNTEWDKRLRGHAWRLDVIGLKNAKKDFNYWKSMQKRVGRDVDQGSLPDEGVFMWRNNK